MLGGERITQEILDWLHATFPRLQRFANLGAMEASIRRIGVGNPRLNGGSPASR